MNEETIEYRNADGTTSQARPIGWQGGIDFEVSGTGPYIWDAWDEDMCVASGRARTKLGLAFALWRAKKSLLPEARK